MHAARVLSDGSSRRRSMLPQIAGSKLGSTRLDSLSEHEDSTSGRPITTLQNQQRIKPSSDVQEETRSVVPPSKLGMSRPVRESAKDEAAPDQIVPSAMRRPSIGKPPSQNLYVTPARTRVSSSSSNHTNSKTASFQSRSASQQLRPTATPSGPSSRTSSLRHSSMNSQRPAFSAMQQQFTRKNANKSRPISPSQPTSKDDIPSADILHLQTDLAQLHLLHRSAVLVLAQWERSAQETFQHRFDALCERHSELKEIAHQQQTLINQLALVHWSQSLSATQVTDKIQLLSRNFSDVYNLLDVEGKYTRILEIFESWFVQALHVRGQREVKAVTAQRSLSFIEGIGDGWKAEAMVLERELTYCLRDLKGFGTVSHTSCLGRILSQYDKMVVNLLGELDVIQWIENEIMIQETFWVENTVDKLASNVSNDIGSLTSIQATVQR